MAEWGRVQLSIPVPPGVEAGVAAAAAGLERVTLTHGAVVLAALLVLRALLQRRVPRVVLAFEDEAEAADVFDGRSALDPRTATPRDAPSGQIRCWDPCTMQDLGTVKAFTPAEVHAAIKRGKAAQAAWRHSTFAQRRHLMHVLSRCITENMDAIVRVACRDSGKAKVDAFMGEVRVRESERDKASKRVSVSACPFARTHTHT